MPEAPENRCGYSYPNAGPNTTSYDSPSCCYREVTSDSQRCPWHVDADETEEKTIENLEETRAPAEVREKTKPYGEMLDGADLRGLPIDDNLDLSEVSLREANFRNSSLDHANLAGSNLTAAVFPNNSLWEANLSDAILLGVDFGESNLTRADLSASNLSGTNVSGNDFSGADLREAFLLNSDFSNCDLVNADLSFAILSDCSFHSANLVNATIKASNLNGVDLTNANISKSTKIWIPSPTSKRDDPDEWDSVARSHHSIKNAYDENGLIREARRHHILERDARTKEAVVSGDLLASSSYLLSKYLTGHGVRVIQVLLVIGFVWSASTLWYSLVGVEDSMYFSVVSFVAAHSQPPLADQTGWVPFVTQLIAMGETFLGTLLIVLLGYVIGNRERV